MAAVGKRSSVNSLASTNPERRQFNRIKKDNTSDKVWGNLESELPKPLDKRFIEVKKRLVTPENYSAVQKSWDRLQIALKDRAAEIEDAGPEVNHESNPSNAGTNLTRSVHSHGRLLIHPSKWEISQGSCRPHQIQRLLCCPWCCQS